MGIIFKTTTQVAEWLKNYLHLTWTYNVIRGKINLNLNKKSKDVYGFHLKYINNI